MATDFSKLKAVPKREEPYHIVVSMAHHDDIEFGVAGSIAKWIKEEGATVTYIIITDGGAGSNEPGVKRADLVARRKEEQIAAAKAVGVTDVRFLNYQDGNLEATMEVRKDITRILRETKPYRVVIQDPTTVFFGSFYINHPDHRAAGEASLYAVFPSSETRPIFPELLDEGFEPHSVKELYINLTENPTHFEDISDYIDTKIESLKAHVSQIGEGEAAENGALKWVKNLDSSVSEQLNINYAEFFRVMKFDQEPESWTEAAQEEADTTVTAEATGD